MEKHDQRDKDRDHEETKKKETERATKEEVLKKGDKDAKKDLGLTKKTELLSAPNVVAVTNTVSPKKVPASSLPISRHRVNGKLIFTEQII